MNPTRLLRPDEAFCPRCRQIFIDGTAFDAHLAGPCTPTAAGLVLKGDVWQWPGRHPSQKPRRSLAEAALDRIVGQTARYPSLDKDVERVRKALFKAKDL